MTDDELQAAVVELAAGEPWSIQRTTSSFYEDPRTTVRLHIFKPGYSNHTLKNTDPIWATDELSNEEAYLQALAMATEPGQIGLGTPKNESEAEIVPF